MFFGYGYYKSTINISKIIPQNGTERNNFFKSTFWVLIKKKRQPIYRLPLPVF